MFGEPTIDPSFPGANHAGLAKMTWRFFCTLLAALPLTFANTACEDDDMSHLQLKETLHLKH